MLIMEFVKIQVLMKNMLKNGVISYGIEFFCLHANVNEISKIQKIGLEEAGRKVRYDFFNEISKNIGATKIGIAHNKNDNGETMLMNILRGSGTNGLKGIRAKQGKYIRPLIEIKRKEIEAFCEQEKLFPRIDESNFNNEFTRNKIRNVVLPYLEKEFNPSIVDALERLSNLAKEQEEYLEKQTVYFY